MSLLCASCKTVRRLPPYLGVGSCSAEARIRSGHGSLHHHRGSAEQADLASMALSMAEKVSSLGFLLPHRPQNQRRCAPFRPACNAPLHTCRSSSSPVDSSQHIDRRALLLSTSTLAAALALERSAQAEGSTHSHTQARHAGPPCSHSAPLVSCAVQKCSLNMCARFRTAFTSH